MFKHLHPNIWLLTLAQAFIGATGPMLVFVGGFIGIELAPEPTWATLPVACMIIGVAFFTLPVVKLFSRIGRRLGFLITVAAGIANCFFIVYALNLENFWLFCAAIMLQGVSLAAVQQFRFAAMESVDSQYAGQAVSILLFAGLGAAILGPEMGLYGKDLLETPFAGSFLLLSLSLGAAFLVLLAFKPVTKPLQAVSGNIRPLSEIARQPIFLASMLSAAVAFAVMSLIMTATPVSMHVDHHFSMADTKWVIQSHIIAMYLPSLATAFLIRWLGEVKLLLLGLAALAICLVIGFIEQSYLHYWSALVLLGLGWNFAFVAATSLLPKSYHEAEKFKVQGLNDMTIFSCQAIASLSAGVLIAQVGWHGLMLLNVPLLMISLAAILYWRFQRKSTAFLTS